jgi:adenine-specific DNA-methyltransferase
MIKKNEILYNLPSTRYQGSKRKLLPQIYNVVKDLKFETVLDGLGGSGVVSYLFKKMNKSVTYNDFLRFNFLSAKAIIQNDNVLLSENDVQKLIGVKSKHNKKIIQNTFKGIYYLPSENIWLDNVITNIYNMNHYPESILKFKKAIAFYSIFQSCLSKRPFNLFHRKNLYIRTKKNIERSFGNKKTWDKSFDKHFTNFIKETNDLVFHSGKKCYAINKSIFNIDNNFDLVYLDPPYHSKDGFRETSNYRKVYHFLEGIARLKTWPSLIDYDSPNLRFKHNGNDFDSVNIYETYEELFYNFRKSKILLSYNTDGIPSSRFFINLLKKMNKKVSTKSFQYNYALSKKTQIREILILAE